jgi:transposase
MKRSPPNVHGLKLRFKTGLINTWESMIRLIQIAELLELAFAHLPTRRYKTNEAAEYYNVQIIRLPIKHCVLNPIELAWSQLKSYVRSNNT